MKTIYRFLIRVFGPRFELWINLSILAVVGFVVLSVFGLVPSGRGPRGGSMFSFVQLFIIYAFLLLVPFGYLVEHWRYAVSLKLVGWIFRLYLLVPILGLVYTGYVASGRYWGSASWPGTDLIEVSTIWFLIFLVHIPLSIPGGIALAVIRFFAQAANEGKDEPEETLSSR